MFYLLLTFFWASDILFAQNKAMEIILLLGVLVSSYEWFKSKNSEIVRIGFWMAIVMVTSLLALLSLTEYFNLQSSRASVLGGGPIVFGRNMALLFIGTLYFEKKNVPSFICKPLELIALICIFLSGSRGAILSILLVIMIVMVMDRKKLLIKLILLVALPLAVFLLLQYTPVGEKVSRIIQVRIVANTIEEQNSSGRVELYSAALQLGMKNPVFGGGLTAFKEKGFSNPYPHNIFLEIFDEGGGLGVFFFVVVIGVFLLYVWRNRPLVDLTAFMAFLFMFFASQTSGDIYDSRWIFFFMLLASFPVLYRIEKEQYHLSDGLGQNHFRPNNAMFTR